MSATNKPVFICATTANDITELWALFDKKIALTTDEATLRYRIATRTNNDVGKRANELAKILERQQIAKQKFEQLGASIVDSSQSVEKVVDEILAITGVS